jgi:hypothetical protein
MPECNGRRRIATLYPFSRAILVDVVSLYPGGINEVEMSQPNCYIFILHLLRSRDEGQHGRLEKCIQQLAEHPERRVIPFAKQKVAALPKCRFYRTFEYL